MNSNGEIAILFKDRDDSYVIEQVLEDAGWDSGGSHIGAEGRTVFFDPPEGIDPKDYVPEPIAVNLPEPIQRMLDQKKKGK